MFLRFILVVFSAIIAAMQHKVTKSYGEPKSPKAIKGYHTPYRLPVTNKKLDILLAKQWQNLCFLPVSNLRISFLLQANHPFDGLKILAFGESEAWKLGSPVPRHGKGFLQIPTRWSV